MSERTTAIGPAAGAADMETLHALFLEYRDWLGVDLRIAAELPAKGLPDTARICRAD